MILKITDEELALKLEDKQIDGVVLREAARRLRGLNSRRSSSQLSSLAGRIMRGEPYTKEEVMSLAASVLSQDEMPDQS